MTDLADFKFERNRLEALFEGRHSRTRARQPPQEPISMIPDDNRDFIERTESVTDKLYGLPMTIDRIADNFALYGLSKRAVALDDLDAELRGEIDSSPHSLRRRVQLMELRRKMGDVHEALRKARR